MSSLKVSRKHLAVRDKCGACGATIVRHERVVALLGTDDGTECSGEVTRPFLFPRHGSGVTKVDGWQLCRAAQCASCDASPECVTVHRDCYEIFKQSCLVSFDDASRSLLLDRLWTIAAWRSPWARPASVVRLADDGLWDNTPRAHQLELAGVADMLGMRHLIRLPRGLLEKILALTPDAPFWRVVSVFCEARRTRFLDTWQLVRLPLALVLDWKRGTQMAYASKGKPGSALHDTTAKMFAGLRYTRITIGHRGISQIERLTEWPRNEGTTTSKQAFVVTASAALEDAQVEIRDGFVRLRFPENCPPPVVWNTSTPPPPEECNLIDSASFSVPASSWQSLTGQFRVVDYQECHGLTFFCQDEDIVGIHVHKEGDDDASRSFSRLAYPSPYIAWIYLPIVRGDFIIGMRARKTSRGMVLLVHMYLAGLVNIGKVDLPAPPEPEDVLLGNSYQFNFVYGEPDSAGQPLIVGTSVDMQRCCDRYIVTDFRMRLTASQKGVQSVFFSTADLCNVTAVDIFRDPSNNHCRGIIVWYQNRSGRALGQCSRPTDEVVSVKRPTHICIGNGRSEIKSMPGTFRLLADAACDPDHTHESPDWICHEIGSAMLGFVFRTSQSGIFTYIWVDYKTFQKRNAALPLPERPNLAAA